jgi:hypothetical protein
VVNHIVHEFVNKQFAFEVLLEGALATPRSLEFTTFLLFLASKNPSKPPPTSASPSRVRRLNIFFKPFLKFST